MIVISLQLRGRRQIAEPRKYCLVCVIVFFIDVCFLYFLFLTGWEFGLIPYFKSFDNSYIILLLYVDDMLIAGSDIERLII